MAILPARDLYQKRGNRITTAPTVEPVTLAEIKTQLRIDATNSDDDDFLTQAITDARQEIEDETGLAFITQVWLMTLDRWPSGYEPWWDGVRDGAISDIHRQDGIMDMPRYPLQSIDAVNVYAEDGTATPVVVADTFDVDTQQIPGRMTLKSTSTWPIATRDINAIDVSYTSGYGDTAAEVPAPIKRAIRSMVAYQYAHRGDDCSPSDAYFASSAASTVGRYKVTRI